MITMRVGKAQNFLIQAVFQQLFTAYNFIPCYSRRESIKLAMAMTMPTTLYAALTNFYQLFPLKHQVCSLPLANEAGSHIKCCRKVILLDYWKSLCKEISEAIIER